MREVAREALAVLRHEVDERMVQLQYRHFPRQAEEGVKVVVLPAGDHDHMGCFTDQVKLTRALVHDLYKAIKEVKLLGEHEESSQKITELEAGEDIPALRNPDALVTPDASVTPVASSVTVAPP
jgi:hypothetical protein